MRNLHTGGARPACAAARRSAFAVVTILLATACAGGGADGSEGPLPTPEDRALPAPEDRALLVSGRITGDTVVLDPAFHLAVAAQLPAAVPGNHRLQGTDTAGSSIFDIEFDGTQVVNSPPTSDGGCCDDEVHFRFAVPLDAGAASRLHRIEVVTADGRRSARTARIRAADLALLLETGDIVSAGRGAGGTVRLTWDGDRFPQIIIRDAETQQILGIGSAGSATIMTELATVQVLISEGVHSGAVTVAIPPRE